MRAVYQGGAGSNNRTAIMLLPGFNVDQLNCLLLPRPPLCLFPQSPKWLISSLAMSATPTLAETPADGNANAASSGATSEDGAAVPTNPTGREEDSAAAGDIDIDGSAAAAAAAEPAATSPAALAPASAEGNVDPEEAHINTLLMLPEGVAPATTALDMDDTIMARLCKVVYKPPEKGLDLIHKLVPNASKVRSSFSSSS